MYPVWLFIWGSVLVLAESALADGPAPAALQPTTAHLAKPLPPIGPDADGSTADVAEERSLSELRLRSGSVPGDRNVDSEVVRERYANRRVKVERQVVQDTDQNYINHGSWKMWDEQGHPVASGQYRYSQRHGHWTRFYRTREVKVLTLPPFDQGRPPFVSQAEFKDGQLDGVWVVFDADQRKLCEWHFAEGRRHGQSSWWYASGRKMRQINYENGSVHGELLEWNPQGQLVTKDRYEDGRRLATKTEHYADQHKRSEGTVLYPRLILEKPDQWWTFELATYRQDGEPEKHGQWISWYQNGQRKLQGQYEHDVPVGQFTWWHVNGQKSLQAHYRDGEQHGTWTWWHANGLKSIQGEYVAGNPVQQWLWWEEDGKVARRADFTERGGDVMTTPLVAEEADNSPRAAKHVERHIQ
jgi:antitoxin component YwqK of YwqJK toxin-antitoxin module